MLVNGIDVRTTAGRLGHARASTRWTSTPTSPRSPTSGPWPPWPRSSMPAHTTVPRATVAVDVPRIRRAASPTMPIWWCEALRPSSRRPQSARQSWSGVVSRPGSATACRRFTCAPTTRCSTSPRTGFRCSRCCSSADCSDVVSVGFEVYRRLGERFLPSATSTSRTALSSGDRASLSGKG